MKPATYWRANISFGSAEGVGVSCQKPENDALCARIFAHTHIAAYVLNNAPRKKENMKEKVRMQSMFLV